MWSANVVVHDADGRTFREIRRQAVAHAGSFGGEDPDRFVTKWRSEALNQNKHKR